MAISGGALADSGPETRISGNKTVLPDDALPLARLELQQELKFFLFLLCYLRWCFRHLRFFVLTVQGLELVTARATAALMVARR